MSILNFFREIIMEKELPQAYHVFYHDMGTLQSNDDLHSHREECDQGVKRFHENCVKSLENILSLKRSVSNNEECFKKFVDNYMKFFEESCNNYEKEFKNLNQDFGENAMIQSSKKFREFMIRHNRLKPIFKMKTLTPDLIECIYKRINRMGNDVHPVDLYYDTIEL
ncbi:hypothetical protein TRFO_09879 [Tritrichomonas foetus]|uniref:Uncharacterized protein n=1 Tax=Tritrichomonas foetus TaxID=1144522 RepID=A0A1J4JGC1_9EUKA|nr:hypothetical protein TRFO_09879 [Tritrichomonas foetus]|eukprot:OHS96501.1 hypothetical protein TRFO_09879 [Tritrichomonas foetus]